MPTRSIDILQHSLLTARLGKAISPDRVGAAEVFSAAMAHDVGKLVLAIGVPERFAEAMPLGALTQRPFPEIEREVLGLMHAEVGAYLLGYWGPPLRIVEVACHHEPGQAPEGSLNTQAAVYVADALVDEPPHRPYEPEARPGLRVARWLRRQGRRLAYARREHEGVSAPGESCVDSERAA
jgi:HD-like signal output (HDOD) protein